MASATLLPQLLCAAKAIYHIAIFPAKHTHTITLEISSHHKSVTYIVLSDKMSSKCVVFLFVGPALYNHYNCNMHNFCRILTLTLCKRQ